MAEGGRLTWLGWSGEGVRVDRVGHRIISTRESSQIYIIYLKYIKTHSNHSSIEYRLSFVSLCLATIPYIFYLLSSISCIFYLLSISFYLSLSYILLFILIFKCSLTS